MSAVALHREKAGKAAHVPPAGASVSNSKIASVLDEIADLLENQNANTFRIRAYRRAARTLESYPSSIAEKVARGDAIVGLPGIGKDLAEKISEIARTGQLAFLKELEHEVPPGLADMVRLEGLGPKRVQLLHERLGISTLDELGRAIHAGRLDGLPGIGAKTVEKIRRSLELHRLEGRRYKLSVAEQDATRITAYVKALPGVVEAVAAGSLRRRKETVGDIDIVASGRGAAVMQKFMAYDGVSDVISRGTTRATVVLNSGIQVDLRLVPPESHGAALHYLTGSKDHNIAVRRLGVEHGFKINEYGVFKGKRRIAGRTEADVYAAVGLPYIEPELREMTGEIEAAQAGRLPHLLAEADICGDLHVHSVASDGRNSIAEMAAAAKAIGRRYIAVCDHSRRVTIAHGLTPVRLSRQIDEIDALNETGTGCRILKSSEVDILENGKLDLPDSILARLDLVVGAVHSKFGLLRQSQTERILRAMDNRYFNILAHPTGRLLGEREAYDVDMVRVMEGAKERGCFLEVNAQPERLDLTDIHCRLAKEIGLKVAISTDAHSTFDLAFMRFGVGQARRGWLERTDVLNTASWKTVQKQLRR